jgi:hypothetical protein
MIMFRGSYGIIKRDFAPELCGNFVALSSLRSDLLTADKRGIKDFPKLPSATSFSRKPLYAIGFETLKIKKLKR